MGGAPVFCGTREPVQTRLDNLPAGESIDDFLEGFPFVTRAWVVALLKQAKHHLVESEGGLEPCVHLKRRVECTHETINSFSRLFG